MNKPWLLRQDRLLGKAKRVLKTTILVALVALGVWGTVSGSAICSGPEANVELANQPAALTPEKTARISIQEFFGIRVVDQETGRGVPLVELVTVHGIRLVTDSHGLAAFYEPGLMDREIFFFVKSHGYEYPADGFGFRGVRLRTTPGKISTIQIRRVNIAKRLYRLTGAGIYRDSVLLNVPVPLKDPVIAGGVLGCDSVQCAVFRGRIFWFWGDTNRASYPLGNFQTTGATSALPETGKIDPEKGIDFDFFTGPDGFVRPMAPISNRGPVWISGPVVIGDSEPTQRLFAHYLVVKPDPNSFETVERGLAEFDPEKGVFEKRKEFPLEGAFPHGGHPIRVRSAGGDYIYYCDPYPRIRVPASADKLADPTAYESLTCLAQRLESEKTSDLKTLQQMIDRDDRGKVRWSWKSGCEPLSCQEHERLIRNGLIPAEAGLFALRDVESGRPVVAHRGSVYWNDFRQAFVMIFCEIGGSSFLGEIWYAEADRLLGPWGYARKIVTHDRYSFYNPKHHPMFDREGGRIIYFEGTYTAAFSGNSERTPWYEYNQIMYRLDLTDTRLVLPVPVYECLDDQGCVKLGTRFDRSLHDVEGLQKKTPQHTSATWGLYHESNRPKLRGKIRFWALDRPVPGARPVFQEVQGCGYRLLCGEEIDPAGGATARKPSPPGEGEAPQVGLTQVGREQTRQDRPIFYVLKPEMEDQLDSYGQIAPRGESEKLRQRRPEAASQSEKPMVLLQEWMSTDNKLLYLTAAEKAPPGAQCRQTLGLVWIHPLEPELSFDP